MYGIVVNLRKNALRKRKPSKINFMKEENVVFVTRYESPYGVLLLGGLGDQLCMCDWENCNNPGLVKRRLRQSLNARFSPGTTEVTEQAATQLDEYFAGRRREFSVPLLFVGTEFQQEVWREMLNVGYGETVSYGELARRIGRPRSVRAVANACAGNAISVFAPCHRVVGSAGRLTGYAGGVEVKGSLLVLERKILG